MDPTSLKQNVETVKEKIAEAAARSGRDSSDIKIMAVTKTFPLEVIRMALEAGMNLLGENRVQEALAKYGDLDKECELHLIGHLQSNKARQAVKLFDCIQSLDKLSTARAVNREAEKLTKEIDVLVQVNTSGEEQKYGIDPENLMELLEGVMELDRLRLRGVMTMAKLTDDRDEIRRSFALARELKEKAETKTGLALPELSMGMSSDYPEAVEEGATMVRIGSAIFGSRG
jgi:hypothetical protein